MLAELSPPEHFQTEGDRRRVEGVYVAIKFEDVRSPLPSCLTDEIVCKLLEDVVVTIGVCLCQIASGNVFA